MAVWSDLTPLDTILINTLHTAIQTAKVDIMDRISANDGTISTHSFEGDSATGLHEISKTGFVKSHTDYVTMIAWIAANAPEDGTLHVTLDTSTIYVIKSATPMLLVSNDHDDFTNLDGDTGHTQYMATSGTRSMSGDLTMADSASITWGGIDTATADTCPLTANHITESWHAAHGDNCLITRHYSTTPFLTQDDLASVTYSNGTMTSAGDSAYGLASLRISTAFPTVRTLHTFPRTGGNYSYWTDFLWSYRPQSRIRLAYIPAISTATHFLLDWWWVRFFIGVYWDQPTFTSTAYYDSFGEIL